MKAAELKQSILQMAFLGELTATWRKKNKVKDKWKEVTIEYFLTKERKSMSTGPFGTMIKKHEHQLYGVPVLGIENIDSGKFVSGNKIFVTPEKAEYLKAFVLKKDDVIISRSGTVGELCLVPDYMEGSLLSTNLMRVTLDMKKMDPQYFVYLFQSKGVIIDQVKELCKGSTRVFLNQTILKQLTFPLPTLIEQKKIVSKIDELVILCDKLEIAENELEILENHFIEYLPKSIIKMAVMGKLVSQNLFDVSANKLLEDIRKYKLKLLKEGKINKEKSLPKIGEDEILYDLPEGWAWCRLGELIELISGRDLETKYFNDKGQGIPYITGASAIENDKLMIDRWTLFPVTYSFKGDLLISCKGTIGKMLYNSVGDCHIARQIMAIRFFHKNVLPGYVKIFLESYVQQLIIQAKSMIPGISRADILFALIPFPPYSEQQRIVAKVDELMLLCDELKTAKNVPVVHSSVSPTIRFPKVQDEESLLMVAQGAPSLEQSRELRQAIDDLFGDEEDE